MIVAIIFFQNHMYHRVRNYIRTTTAGRGILRSKDDNVIINNWRAFFRRRRAKIRRKGFFDLSDVVLKNIKNGIQGNNKMCIRWNNGSGSWSIDVHRSIEDLREHDRGCKIYYQLQLIPSQPCI